MAKTFGTLGGSTFVWNGVKQDYNFIETLNCLYDLCDEIAVAYGGDDGTVEAIDAWSYTKDWSNKSIQGVRIPQEDWDAQVGREKLSYFSNIAIDMLSTEFNFYLQADEILHEDSFYAVRAAIEHGDDVDAFMVRRYNLFKDPYHLLNVPQERKPCSTEVIRLARTQYRCVDDAESIAAPRVAVFGDLDTIVIFHMGFVRDKKKMLVKVRHMLTEVFGWSNDTRAEDCEEFMWDRFFKEDDLIQIPKPLPKYIQRWAEDRYPTTKNPFM